MCAWSRLAELGDGGLAAPGSAGPQQASMARTEASSSSTPRNGGEGGRGGASVWEGVGEEGRRGGCKTASPSFQQPHSQPRLWSHNWENVLVCPHQQLL